MEIFLIILKNIYSISIIFHKYILNIGEDNMDKKWAVLALILCIVIAGIGFFTFNGTFSSNNIFHVGSTTFKLPDGYVEGSPNQYGAQSITDGKYSVFLIEYDDTNVSKHINDYDEKFVKNKNQTIEIINFTIDDNVIQKSHNAHNQNNVHYWFVKNGKSYEIYKWDDNPKMDYIVNDLVKSLGSTS